MSELGQLLSLEYGSALLADQRAGFGFPVFGSNGEVGRHARALVDGPGIVVGRKGSVGKVCWSEEPFWPIDTTYWVKCVAEQRRWVYWLLSRLPLSDLDSSTGVPGLNRNDVYELTVYEPATVDEKAKIAEVLDTLDTTIRQTGAIIEKLKQLKQGLRHDLLTRGIDVNGELRPPQEAAPSLYKPSLLGWIPQDWETPTLTHVCGLIRDGTHLPPVRVAEGPLLLSVRNIQEGEFILTDQDTRVSEAFYRQMHKTWEVRKGDLLLAIVGATIGKTAIVGDMPKFTLQRSVAILRGRPERLLNEFLHLYMQSPEFQASLWAQVNQTAQPGIYLDQLGAIAVRLPLPLEQEAIWQRLQAAQNRIDIESDVVKKLSEQRSGLMDDLLTGRVRVTPLLDAAASARS